MMLSTKYNIWSNRFCSLQQICFHVELFLKSSGNKKGSGYILLSVPKEEKGEKRKTRQILLLDSCGFSVGDQPLRSMKQTSVSTVTKLLPMRGKITVGKCLLITRIECDGLLFIKKQPATKETDHWSGLNKVFCRPQNIWIIEHFSKILR